MMIGCSCLQGALLYLQHCWIVSSRVCPCKWLEGTVCGVCLRRGGDIVYKGSEKGTCVCRGGQWVVLVCRVCVCVLCCTVPALSSSCTSIICVD